MNVRTFLAATLVAGISFLGPTGLANAETPTVSSTAASSVGRAANTCGSGCAEKSYVSAEAKGGPTIATKATAERENTYSVHGLVTSLAVYQHFSVTVEDGGKTFTGDSGGISIPGVAVLKGTLFTDDLQRLYNDTVSFEYNAVGPYMNINFFDSHGTLLGHVQSGSIGTLTGIGGGTGGWQ
ncbi:virulence-associated protein VapO [Prescottella equi]|uniref:Virulence-associated protein VapO n=1 Tax=Rhodococcus hoagii TaxID=43767 RepID=A0A0F6WFT5_RHOHA|nr:virulence-associated protein VapO [Prescottella equi]AKF16029.1 virulence-associated protein VapO [Prescottella equi]AKG90527.1 virulence-associated protein VapO [Prescottella equi]ARX59678.1 virulence-associated protein [Prescottella equi]ARX59821.1 virulence-associated protein [Prescottella equi]ARX59968.1 virulence-associated protein [Prescottella equi]